MTKRRIAVASTDGQNVNEHFGKSGQFLIYNLDEEGMSFVEKRSTETLSVGDPQHTSSMRKNSIAWREA